MSINNLTYSDTFKKWFDTTNSVISEINGITVHNILAGDGIGITSSSNVFTISHAPVVSGGVTFSGNVNFTGVVSFTNSPVNTSTTIINISPKSSGITAGNVVRVSAQGLTLARADSAENAEVLGIVVNETSTANVVAVSGLIDNTSFSQTISNALGVPGATLFAGQAYFLSSAVAGGITTNEPQTYGHVSKPIILGITGNSGSILTYRGILLEGISYGITAELDNKLIVELDYSSGRTVSGDVKVGDPVCYLEDAAASEGIINGYNGVLQNRIKAWGKINNSSYDCAFIINAANWTDPTVFNKYQFLGLVSKIIQNVGSKYVLEVTLPGGTITTTASQLDSNFYTNTSETAALEINSNSRLQKTTTTSKFVDFIKINDTDNTVKIVLRSSANSGVLSGSLPGATPSGITANLEYYNLIPNGSFSIWQRPAPIYFNGVFSASASYTTNYLLQPSELYQTDGSGVYTYYWHKYIDPLADRWFIIRDLSKFTYPSGLNTKKGLTGEVLRKSFVSNQAEVSGSPLYYVDCNFDYTLSPVELNMRPRLENIQPNARLGQNQTVTYSFWAKSNVSGATIDVIYNRYKEIYTTENGFTADLEGRVNVTNTSGGITLGTSWKLYKRTFNMGVAGFTLGNADLGWFGIGFEFPSRPTATISLAQAQLQLGNEMAEPLHIPYEEELKRCKQVFQSSFDPGVTFVYSGNINYRKGATNRSANKNIGIAQIFSLNGNVFRYPTEMIRGVTGVITGVGADANVQFFSTIAGTRGQVTVQSFDASINKDSDLISSGDAQKLPWQSSDFTNGTSYNKFRSAYAGNPLILPVNAGRSYMSLSITNANTIVPFDTIFFDYILDADITSSIYIPGFATRINTTKIYL